MKEQDEEVKWFNTVFYPQKKTGRAARYEDGILPRLREKEIVLFTPWGPRYNWEGRGAKISSGDKEVMVLRFLARLFGELQQNMPGKNFRWVFLGADLYGMRINKLPGVLVNDYFASLLEWLKQILPMAEFKLWSQFDVVAEEYRQEVRTNVEKFVSRNLLSRASQTARAMGRGGDPSEYLIERFAEAMFIEKTLRPIKISCVGRHKDEGVDLRLPRLYFLPEHFQAPWL